MAQELPVGRQRMPPFRRAFGSCLEPVSSIIFLRHQQTRNTFTLFFHLFKVPGMSRQLLPAC